MKTSKRVAVSIVAAICALFALTASASAAPPINDNFLQDSPLMSGVATTGTNAESTLESGEGGIRPAWGLHNSVWFSFTPQYDGVVSFSACSNFPSNIVVVTGATLATAQLAQSGPDSASQSVPTGCPGGPNINAVNGVPVSAGVTVRIHLGSALNTFTGNYSITANYIPDIRNDDFADAEELTGANPTIEWDNEFASDEVGEPKPYPMDKTLWYKWTAPEDGWLIVSACPTESFATVVSVYTGDELTNLVNPIATDEGCNNGGAKTGELVVTEGTAYYIQVGGSGSATGTSPLDIDFDTVPVNDNVAGAIDLGDEPLHIISDNRHATNPPEEGEPNLKGDQRKKSVWFKWTSPVTTNVKFDNCADPPIWTVDGIMGVFQSNGSQTDPAPSDLVGVPATDGDGDDNCDGGVMGRMTVPVIAGKTYWIAVANYPTNSPGQKFVLNITFAPVSTTQPEISGANFFVGTELTATTGDWAGVAPISYTYEWQRCEPPAGDCDPIDDTDHPTYTLTEDDEGYIIRVRILAANGDGTGVAVSERTVAIDVDSDNDGVGDTGDACPDNAQGPGKSNGCPIEDVSVTTDPSISGTAQVGSTLSLTIGSAENTPGLDSSIAAPSSEIHWFSCESATLLPSCVTRAGSTTSYVPTAADVGRFIRAQVVWFNDDNGDAAPYSAATGAVAAAPIVDPPAGDRTTPPSAPLDPLKLAVKKKLGTITPKKGGATITAAVVTCDATADGTCTGTVTLTTTVKKKQKKFATAKISVAPGKSSPVIVKLTSSQLKAVAKAGKLKFTAKFKVTGPGFPPATATATGTLKPQLPT